MYHVYKIGTIPVIFLFVAIVIVLAFVSYEDAMTEEEKNNNPYYKVTKGYVKVYEYKEAWRKAWDGASLEDRKEVLNLPNFDNDIFQEITGIDVNKELNTNNYKIIFEGREIEISKESAIDLGLIKGETK